MRKHRFIRCFSGAFALIMSAMMAASAVMMPVSAKTGSGKDEDKTETVYVNADAEGNITDITVSDWLRNKDGSAVIEDKSRLSDIKNTKGDETFTEESDGSVTWKADGNDIYYQGSSDEELPVSVKVTYYLDGKKIKGKDLAGKSGKVKIRFDYDNNAYEQVEVNGKKYTVNIPFTCISAMILDSEYFDNIEVENGQVISDGDRNIVVGMAFPGLSNSLSLSSYEKLEDVDIPEYVEVTADAEDFQISLTGTVIKNGLTEDMDLHDLDDVDDLKDDIDKLTDASGKLVDGSRELSDGLKLLNGSFGTYGDGVKKAGKGSSELSAGLKKIDKNSVLVTGGAKDLKNGLVQLKEGTASLKQGINDYTDGLTTLDQAISQVADGTGDLREGAKALESGTEGMYAGMSRFSAGMNQLCTSLSAVSSSLEKARESVSLPDAEELAKVEAARKQLDQDLEKLQKLSDEIDKAFETIENIKSKTQTHNEQVKKQYDDTKKALDKVNDKADDAANDSLKSQAGQIDGKATEKARSAAKDAVNGVSLPDADIDGLTPEQKKKVEEKLSDLKKNCASAAGGISVSGTTDGVSLDTGDVSADAEAALGDQALTLEIPEIEKPSEDLKALMADIDTQLKVLTDFSKKYEGLAEYFATVKGCSGNLKEISAGFGQLKESLSGEKGMLDGMKDLKQGASSMHTGIETLQLYLDMLKAGSGQLNENSPMLRKGAEDLDQGTGQILNGTGLLIAGADTYTNAIHLASQGSDELSAGMGKLTGATNKVGSGIGKLADGSGELSDGMSKFDDEGISKISDLAGEDLQNVIYRVKALKKADGKYDNYSGKAKGAKSSVRFIIETEQIGGED
ncbi:MAG: hypothetical protein IJH71_03795 [Eubacterium sp.]|nr:hypothetical protein [Eubacterium sp.]